MKNVKFAGLLYYIKIMSINESIFAYHTFRKIINHILLQRIITLSTVLYNSARREATGVKATATYKFLNL